MHWFLVIAPFNPKPLRSSLSANKHKPWIETEYQGIVMENDNTVLLNPPLFALDKDAPLHYAGNATCIDHNTAEIRYVHTL